MIALYYTEKTKYWPSFKQQSCYELGAYKINYCVLNKI